MTIVLHSRDDFTLDHYGRAAWGRESVRFDAEALTTMHERRRQFLALIEDPDVVVYGVTSGYGQMAHLRFSAEERRQHSRRPPSAAATGFGEPLPERVVRGFVFARLANYIEGHSAISPGLAQAVAAMLDGGPLPSVPLRGNGSAGEISALSYLFHELATGQDLGEKDVLALINGSPCATAFVADSVLAARRRLEEVTRVFALSFEAIKAPLEQIDAILEDLWDNPWDAEAVSALRRLVRGGDEARRPYQAPVSWRILPRILGQGFRALANAESVALHSLRAITDNPIFLPPDETYPRGRVISNGGYHNAQTPAAIDELTAVYADFALLADRHVSKLLNGRVSHLPDQLITTGGYLGCVGFSALAFAEDARYACQRSLLPGSEGGGFGQNDVASPVFFAWRRHQEAAMALDSVLACLAVVASQAFHATNRGAPPALRPLLEEIRSFVPPVEGSRLLGPELESLANRFSGRVLSWNQA